MKRFLIALQFLTIIPIKKNIAFDEDSLAKSTSFFVLVGLLQGLLLIATDYLARRIFHSDLVAGLILLVLVLSNGGFHLDGLSDTFDALALKSEGDAAIDKQKRLAIMKTGTAGPIGVTAIFFVLALKYLALNNLSHFQAFTYFSSLLLMPVLSKWAIVMSMFYGNPAREDGLGRIFINRINLREIVTSTGILLVLIVSSSVVFSRFFSLYVPDKQYIFYISLLLSLSLFCCGEMMFFKKKFGGLTGDMLGATSELTEIIFLFMVIAWSRFSI
jgi:adenosylcobinamide-GDP ribazoletransferase